MKKKSILLTCIVAIMALAMFVGCDNAPELPSFVVNGNIEQTGDFLVGQVFDPGKFSVTVRYDNGKTAPADDTVLVQLVKATGNTEKGIVELGDSVVADLGIAYDTDVRTVTAAIQAYQIDHVEVVGPESYTDEVEFADIDKLGLSATAYYYGEDRTQLSSMPLSSGEWELMASGIEYVDGVEPSASNPEVSAWINVEALGQENIGKYNFKVTFTPAASITADMITKINNIAIKENTEVNLYAWEYENVPRPNFSDYVINVTLNDGTSTNLTEDPGLILSYIKGKDSLPLTDKNLNGYESMQFAVRAELGDIRYQTEVIDKIKVYDVVVNLEAADDSINFDMTEKEALPAIDASDFVVTYTVDGIKDYLEVADGVEFVYSSSEIEIVPISGNIAPEKDSRIAVFATYHGVPSNGVFVGAVKEATPEPVLASISLKLAAGIEYPAKMVEYNTVPTLSASDVIVTASYTGGKDNAVVTPSEVGYSTTNEGNPVKATVKSFTGSNSVYVYAVYTEGTGEAAITKYAYSNDIRASFVTAYPTELEVTFDYETMNAAKTEPMVGSKLTNFAVNAVNDDGVVSKLSAGDYTFIKNGDDKEITITDVVVKTTAEDFQVYALVNTSENVKEFITSDVVRVDAGLGYIAEEAISALEFNLASGYDNRVGQIISGNAGDYVVTVGEDGAEYIHEGYDGVPAVRIEDVAVVGNKKIEADGNEVLFTVSYVDETGEEQTVQIQNYDTGDTWTFKGVSGVVVDGENIGVLYDGSSFTGTVDPYTTYTVADFTLDDSTYEVYGGKEANPILVVQKDGRDYNEETCKPGWNDTEGFSVKVTYIALTLDDETGLYVAAEKATEYVIDMVGRA